MGKTLSSLGIVWSAPRYGQRCRRRTRLQLTLLGAVIIVGCRRFVKLPWLLCPWCVLGAMVSLQKWHRMSLRKLSAAYPKQRQYTHIWGGASRAPIAALFSSVPLTVMLERILLPLAMSNLALTVYIFQ